MAEPGSLADRVKQQADIVRIVGDYVRLKKSGQNYLGLCPFHQEKTPSFAVHPGKQIYHCFGCGAGGDVFRFVMEIEKCSFPEAVRLVAEKSGLALPTASHRAGTGESAELRRALLALHREAAEFYARQLEATAEGRVARAYLEDRGLRPETMARFGLGYAPAAGDALYRFLRGRYPANVLERSGLFLREPGGAWLDRLRRRIVFPLANEAGRIVAFAGRALADESPKYLNSPETPIYVKSRLLYNLDRAREAIRREGFAVLVEGYMDAIALCEAGVENVVASCGTSLAETQVRLLGRYTRQVVVNFDQDAAGQAATDRSINLLLASEFQVRVLILPATASEKTDPDRFVRQHGADRYREQLAHAPLYLDYLLSRARQLATGGVEGKLQAVNYLLPYLRLMPNRLVRIEWATRIAAELQIEFGVLRQAWIEAAAERRAKVAAPAPLVEAAITPAERRLLQLLLEADEGLRVEVAQRMLAEELHRGLETEELFAAVLPAAVAGATPAAMLARAEELPAERRRLLFALAVESGPPATAEEAHSCLAVLRRRRRERELQQLQAELRRLEANPPEAAQQRLRLLERIHELRRALADEGR